MSTRERIVVLDVLRGFALCGILLANVKPIAHRGAALGDDHTTPSLAANIVHLLVDARFFPIFAFLFGVGFSLMARDAPRTVLVRRLLFLLALGLAHMFLLWRGDILTFYAAFGLLVLLPSTWLPRRVVAVLAAVLIVVSAGFLGGYVTLIPGLFLLGSALTRYGLVERLDRTPAWSAVVLAGAAVPVVLVQGNYAWAYPTAGLLLGGVYVCTLIALFRTALRPFLIRVFAPLGRMALTNYLGATVLVLAVTAFVHGSDSWQAGPVILLAASILTLQWCWSTLWLSRFRQGPLEWVWRQVTWARRMPLARVRVS